MKLLNLSINALAFWPYFIASILRACSANFKGFKINHLFFVQKFRFLHMRGEALADDFGRAIFPRRERFLDIPTADMKERTMSKPKIKWKNEPETEDYEGGKNLLTLICSYAEAVQLIERLQKSDTIERAPKDLLRAAGLPLLDQSDPRVAEDLKRIHKGTPLPPVLLIRGELKKGHPLIIADGYHRICAVYSCDESASIPCRMATQDKM